MVVTGSSMISCEIGQRNSLGTTTGTGGFSRVAVAGRLLLLLLPLPPLLPAAARARSAAASAWTLRVAARSCMKLPPCSAASMSDSMVRRVRGVHGLDSAEAEAGAPAPPGLV